MATVWQQLLRYTMIFKQYSSRQPEKYDILPEVEDLAPNFSFSDHILPDCSKVSAVYFKFDMNPCKEFLKPEFVDLDVKKSVPRSFVKDSYANFLTCVQRYFTCEGRYHKVYSYHFKLLLHFTRNISLDLPFYLFRSLGKMCDKVQSKKEACETSLFHHGLLKLIVLHEL